MRGLSISENAMGFTAVRCHYTADPDKWPEHPDPIKAAFAQKWLDMQKSLWPDPTDFEREFEINFHVGKGSRVFPQFSETYHARSVPFNRRKVIYRGWDFGWHAPICLVAQVDSQDRLLVIREIVGQQMTTQEFAQRVIQICAEKYPFHAAGFEDYCDPAGQQVKTIASEKSEKRDIDILNGLGIYPKYEYGWSNKHGRSLIHQLLGLRTDGTPGVYVDSEGCPLLMQSFLGRYIYPEKRDGTIHEDPDDDTHPWADLVAALRYLVTGLHVRLSLRRAFKDPYNPPIMEYHGYGSPLPRMSK